MERPSGDRACSNTTWLPEVRRTLAPAQRATCSRSAMRQSRAFARIASSRLEPAPFASVTCPADLRSSALPARRRRRNDTPRLAHRLDPAAHGILGVDDRLLDGLPVGHAAREVGELDEVAAPIVVAERPNGERVGNVADHHGSRMRGAGAGWPAPTL